MTDHNRKGKPCVGLDIGTMTIVGSWTDEDGHTKSKQVRDVFIDLDIQIKKMVRLTNVSFLANPNRADQFVVVGDSALGFVNLFNRELRRPLSKGIISPGETDAQFVLVELIKNVLGEPITTGEHCYYSVPSSPIDDPDQDIVYHTEIFRRILNDLGYTGHPENEAMAVIYSQCSNENFSGLATSFGAGMVNVALAYQTVCGLSFAVSRGGDWVGKNAAKAMGISAARMCSIKEKGIDISKPVNREEEAIALYIRSLIKYCLENISIQFKKARSTIDLPEPIPFIISGGTSRAKGFLEVFKQEFEVIKKLGFPIEISEIRNATNPMTAVAEGLLILAKQEEAT